MANKHTNRSSISLLIKEMKNKTTMKYHCTLTKIDKSQEDKY